MYKGRQMDTAKAPIRGLYLYEQSQLTFEGDNQSVNKSSAIRSFVPLDRHSSALCVCLFVSVFRRVTQYGSELMLYTLI